MIKNFIALAVIFIVIMFCGLNYAEELPSTSEVSPVKSEDQTTKTKGPSVKSEGPITKMECSTVKSEGPITGKRRLGMPIGYTDERAGWKTTKGESSYEGLEEQQSGAVEEETPDKMPPILQGVEFGFPRQDNTEKQ